MTETADGDGTSELTVGELAARYAQILAGRTPIASLDDQDRNAIHGLLSTAEEVIQRHALLGHAGSATTPENALVSRVAERWLTPDLIGGFEPMMMSDWIPGSAMARTIHTGYARLALGADLDILQLRAAATAPLDDHFAESALVRTAMHRQAIQQTHRPLARVFAPETSPELGQAMLEEVWSDPAFASAEVGSRPDASIDWIHPYPRSMSRTGSRMIPGTHARAAQMWTANAAPEMLRLLASPGDAVEDIGSTGEERGFTTATRSKGPMTLQAIARAIVRSRSHTGATTTQMMSPPVGPSGFAGDTRRSSLLDVLASVGPLERAGLLDSPADPLEVRLEAMAPGLAAMFEATRATGSSRPDLTVGYDAMDATWVALQPTRMASESILGASLQPPLTPIGGVPPIPRPAPGALPQGTRPIEGPRHTEAGLSMSRWILPQAIPLALLARANAPMGSAMPAADASSSPDERLGALGAHPNSILAALSAPFLAAPASGEAGSASFASQAMRLPLAHIHRPVRGAALDPAPTAARGAAPSPLSGFTPGPASSPVSALTDSLLVRHLLQSTSLLKSPAAMAAALSAPASLAETLVSLQQRMQGTSPETPATRGTASAWTDSFSQALVELRSADAVGLDPSLEEALPPSSPLLPSRAAGLFDPATLFAGVISSSPFRPLAAPPGVPIAPTAAWSLATNRAAWNHIQLGRPQVEETGRVPGEMHSMHPAPETPSTIGFSPSLAMLAPRAASSTPLTAIEAAPGVFVSQHTGRSGGTVPAATGYAAEPGDAWTPRASRQTASIASQILSELTAPPGPGAGVSEGAVGSWDSSLADPTLVQLTRPTLAFGSLRGESAPFLGDAPLASMSSDRSAPQQTRSAPTPPARSWSWVHQRADRMATAQPGGPGAPRPTMLSIDAPRLARAARASLDFSLPLIASHSLRAPAWMEATRETGPLADAPVSGDVPTLLALAASPQDTLKTALGRLFSARLGAAHASPSRIGLQETMKALLSEQRGGKASSMLGSGGTRFSSEMLVRIARGVDAVGAGPPGTGRAKPRTEPSRTAGRGVVGGPGATVERRTPLAQERIERALITPATVTASSATAGIDLASITKTAMRSAGMAAPSRPLISPVSHAVATRAHLSKEDEAPEAAQAAQAAPAKKAETAPKSTPIDLDALAMELAGKISDRMQRDVERRGRW